MSRCCWRSICVGFVEGDVVAAARRGRAACRDSKSPRRSTRTTAGSTVESDLHAALSSMLPAGARMRSTIAMSSSTRCAQVCRVADCLQPLRTRLARRLGIVLAGRAGARVISSPSRTIRKSCAGAEQMLAVVPRRGDQRDAAGERLEHADRRDAGQQLRVEAPRHVHGCEVSREHLRRAPHWRASRDSARRSCCSFALAPRPDSARHRCRAAGRHRARASADSRRSPRCARRRPSCRSRPGRRAVVLRAGRVEPAGVRRLVPDEDAIAPAPAP